MRAECVGGRSKHMHVDWIDNKFKFMYHQKSSAGTAYCNDELRKVNQVICVGTRGGDYVYM